MKHNATSISLTLGQLAMMGDVAQRLTVLDTPFRSLHVGIRLVIAGRELESHRCNGIQALECGISIGQLIWRSQSIGHINPAHFMRIQSLSTSTSRAL